MVRAQKVYGIHFLSSYSDTGSAAISQIVGDFVTVMMEMSVSGGFAEQMRPLMAITLKGALLYNIENKLKEIRSKLSRIQNKNRKLPLNNTKYFWYLN